MDESSQAQQQQQQQAQEQSQGGAPQAPGAGQPQQQPKKIIPSSPLSLPVILMVLGGILAVFPWALGGGFLFKAGLFAAGLVLLGVGFMTSK